MPSLGFHWKLPSLYFDIAYAWCSVGQGWQFGNSHDKLLMNPLDHFSRLWISQMHDRDEQRNAFPNCHVIELHEPFGQFLPYLPQCRLKRLKLIFQLPIAATVLFERRV